MRFYILLFFALFCATATAQVTPPAVPAPDSVTTFYPTYQAATEGSEKSTAAYRMPCGAKYPVFVSQIGYTVFCLAYEVRGFYRLILNDETTAAAK